MKTYRASQNHRRHHGALILEAVRGLGLSLPKQMRQAADLLAALEARRKAMPSDFDLRAQTVDRLLADPSATVADLAALELARDVEANALAEAADRARDALSAVTMQCADELVIAARTEVFGPAVATLTTAANLPAGMGLRELVAAKRHKEAEAVSMAPVAAEQVKSCIRVRDRLCRSETTGMATRVWKNPSSIDWAGAEATTGAERYIEGLRRGGELWLGTYAEVDDADRQAKAAAKAKKQAAAAEADRRIRGAIAADRARRAERASVRA